MGFKSGKLDGQSRTAISWTSWLLAYDISKPVGSSFSTLDRCWGRLEMEIGICQWQVSSALKYPSRQLLDLGLNKTQWTNTHRLPSTPNHHSLRKLYTGLPAPWILHLSILPPNSRTLVSKIKDDFAPLSSSSCSLLPRFKSGLILGVVPFLETSVHGGSWCTPALVHSLSRSPKYSSQLF